MELSEEKMGKLIDALEGPSQRSLMKSLRLGAFWMIGSIFFLCLGGWSIALLSDHELAPVMAVLVLGFALIIGLLAFGLDMLSNALGSVTLPLWIKLVEELGE